MTQAQIWGALISVGFILVILLVLRILADRGFDPLGEIAGVFAPRMTNGNGNGANGNGAV